MQKVTLASGGKLLWLPFSAGLAVLLALAGCTIVDSADIPGADQPFPNLATVPDRPIPSRDSAARQAEEDALALDRAAAAPLGSAPAGEEGAAKPHLAAAGAKLPNAALAKGEIDARAIAGGGWLNGALREAASGGLAGIIFFENGSSQLKPKAKDVLRAIAAVQRERGGVLRLVGHASSTTNTEDPAKAARINRYFAQRRAELAAGELARYGLTRDQIEIESEGAAAPAYDEADALGESGNRRVEIYLEL